MLCADGVVTVDETWVKKLIRLSLRQNKNESSGTSMRPLLCPPKMANLWHLLEKWGPQLLAIAGLPWKGSYYTCSLKYLGSFDTNRGKLAAGMRASLSRHCSSSQDCCCHDCNTLMGIPVARLDILHIHLIRHSLTTTRKETQRPPFWHCWCRHKRCIRLSKASRCHLIQGRLPLSRPPDKRA